MDTGRIASVKNSEHYIWGDNSDGWHLLKNDDLSVIEERMPPGSSERLHFHEIAQQVFYILSGHGSFEIDEKIIDLEVGDTVHVLAETPHRIFNKSNSDLRFVVISTPKSHGDRIDV